MMKRPHRNSRATHDAPPFTLIELLVVIAIIAILAAMLLPALTRVREKGREIVCMGTEKQMVSMLISYVDDFRNLPGYGYDGREWIEAPGDVCVDPPNSVFFHRRSLLDPYGLYALRSTSDISPNLYRYGVYCPTTKAMSTVAGYNISAAMVANLSNLGGVTQAVSPLNLRLPAKAGVFAEHSCVLESSNMGIPANGFWKTEFWCHGIGVPNPGLTVDHAVSMSVFFLGSRNHAFMDGHVEAVTYKKALGHWYQYCLNDYNFYQHEAE